jgi:lysophospholipase L1-like esterase
MKNILKNIFLSLCSLFFCFVVFEIGIRILTSAPKKAKWNDRPLFYYIPANAKSLRAGDFNKKKEAGTFRVAVLGDSFSFSPFMQFDDAFPKKLERMLNLEGVRKVEVINFGVPGYSTSHEVIQAKRFLIDAEFDLVLLQITLNDLEIKKLEPRGMSVLTNRFARLDANSWKNPILKNLKSLGFIASKIHNYLAAESYKDYYFRLYKNEHALELFKKSIHEISEITKTLNAPLVAVVFPLFGYALDETYPFNEMHNIVHKTLSEEKIPFLDLFNSFKGSHYERLTVMPGDDFHPNEIAHRMAAEEIYLWLLKENKIPPEIVIKSAFTSRTQIVIEKAKKVDFTTLKSRSE